jgi:transitional endoplasmic reticulum ATPase
VHDASNKTRSATHKPTLTSEVRVLSFASAVEPIYSQVRVSRNASSSETDPLAEPIADYIHNLLMGTSLRRLDKHQLVELEDIRTMQHTAASALGMTGPAPSELTTARMRRGLQRYIRDTDNHLRVPRPLAEPYAKNLRWLSETLGLNDAETAILQLVLVVQASSVEQVLDVLVMPEHRGFVRLVATLVARPEEQVERALMPEGRLLQTGLVTLSRTQISFIPKITLRLGISDLVMTPGLDRSLIIARFLPEVPRTDLGWSDFAHVDEQACLAREILRRALQARATGVNVLFYGVTGAGKTALASAIAREVGATLYNIVSTSDKDDGATTSGRLASLVLGEKVLADITSLLLFDELEDLFSWGSSLFQSPLRGTPTMSKQWFNQFLESNRIPIIWISNRVEGIDSAFLRRFTYVLEFRPLGVRQRATILLRHVGTDSALTQDDAHAIASRFPVSPAQVASAVRATRLVTSSGAVERPVLERILAPTEKLVGERSAIDLGDLRDGEYDVRAVNASADLLQLADRLADWRPSGKAGLTLCLYGPPGTGKSEFVRYLAQRMGRPVLYRSASDLMRPYVGQTEQRIAEAFREAEDRDAVLLFDEVDSFLRDRRLAMRSWEVTETNEFLQQLERQRGVVVCTTNLWHDIDAAALRRFIIKVQFHYLTGPQSVTLFVKLFRDYLARPLDSDESAHVGATLAKLNNLAPGDFAAVSRSLAAFGGGDHTPEQLLDLLVAEVRAKGSTTRRAGFL